MASFSQSFAKITAGALLALGAVCVVGVAPAGADGGGVRVGVVRFQYAREQTEDGIRAKNTLRKLFEKRQKDVDARKADLERMYDDIGRQQGVLSRETFGKRMEDFQKRTADFQTQFLKVNEELQKKQAELVSPIDQRMMRVISRVAKKNGFDVVVDAQAALYARSDLDVTDQVIQLYNGGGDDSGGGDDKGDKKDEKKEAPKDAPKP